MPCMLIKPIQHGIVIGFGLSPLPILVGTVVGFVKN